MERVLEVLGRIEDVQNMADLEKWTDSLFKIDSRLRKIQDVLNNLANREVMAEEIKLFFKEVDDFEIFKEQKQQRKGFFIDLESPLIIGLLVLFGAGILTVCSVCFFLALYFARKKQSANLERCVHAEAQASEMVELTTFQNNDAEAE